ncbi:MAG: bifunctional phosphopantothenoylcysteine decarboxylase/phosphopantothenate--cysteine ligase CoaBC [Bacillota bacterium]
MEHLTILKGKNIIIGVTGGIAAYKACELVSSLVKSGADVRVVMTEAAQKFVSPITFSALTHNPTVTDMFSANKSIPHIELLEKADMLAVVPATANIIGKLANGIADDCLSTFLLAAVCPVVIAPAMNINMYQHAAVQHNISLLKSRGIHIIEPSEGYLACGTKGKGRLPDVSILYKEMIDILQQKKDLMGIRVLVTAGGTREPIDPVRYISNRSSGKMGYAIAECAKARGAEITMITTVHNPINVDRLIQVETAQEMYEKVLAYYYEHDIIIMAAAVADYTCMEISSSKIKKKDDILDIKLIKTPDILAELGEIKKDKILVGFAAETDDIECSAMKKLNSKNLDLIVANDVSQKDIGFGSDNNQVSIFNHNGLIIKTPCLTKKKISDIILDTILETDSFIVLRNKKRSDMD